MTQEKRYRHIASLSRTSGLWWNNNEGTCTYKTVFAKRYKDDRFAILYDPITKEYLCVDMWNTTMEKHSLEIHAPDADSFPTEDAAVMAARMKL